ncbi:hypothetical protein FBZ98_103812 [Rhizobium sp. ERR 922]|nr:hypothetical protein FBZ98_103812 [Rhizobium sp. ERR 922]TWB97250.1 hypothetical protein FBZ97_10371 [Rhizobium sp. ERR 942]
MAESETQKPDPFIFKKAPEDAPADVRMAVAMEFIAKHIGEISRSVDHLNTQMDSLVRAAEM